MPGQLLFRYYSQERMYVCIFDIRVCMFRIELRYKFTEFCKLYKLLFARKLIPVLVSLILSFEFTNQVRQYNITKLLNNLNDDYTFVLNQWYVYYTKAQDQKKIIK